MSNKKQLLREVIESSNDSVKDLYSYAKELDWQQVHQRDIFDEYLDDDKFMLSVFHQIRQDSTLGLEEELKQGWFDVLPFVYYDFFVMDQRYIKNIDATERQVDILVDKQQRLTEKGNQIPIQNEDKLEANKKSISKVTGEIIEKHGQIHEKYRVGVPYSIKELIFSREEADSLLTGYKSEHRNSLITIREEYKNHLSKINKRLYWRFLQCSPYSNFEEVKGMLSWLMAGEYKSKNYLYFLDEKLLLNLEGIEEAEIHEQFFKFLNADRRVGAETHFRIKLLDYVIRCKRRGDASIDIQDFNNLYTDKQMAGPGESDYWDKLGHKKQSNIIAFLSGRRKENKPYYKFILSILELNWNGLNKADNTAVIDVAKRSDQYAEFESIPTVKPQTELIQKYKNNRPK